MRNHYLIPAVVLALAMFVGFGRSTAEPEPPAADAGYERTIAGFYAKLEAGKGGEAVKGLYAGNPWMKVDALANVVSQLDLAGSMAGAFLRHTRLAEHPVDDRFIHIVEVAYYQRQPFVFEFTFYRPADEWMIFGYSFDDDFDDEIQKTARWEAFHR